MAARRCLYSYTDYFLALSETATATTKNRGDIVRGKVRFAFDPLVMYNSKMQGLVQVRLMGSSCDVDPIGAFVFCFYSQEILFYQLFTFPPRIWSVSVGILWYPSVLHGK